MAIKDWRFLGTNSLGESAWYNEKKQIRFEIQKEDGMWIVTRDLKDLPYNKFTTKSNAILRVKNEMKKIK